MEEKWRPLFQRISEESNIAFDRVVLTSDYRHGKRTFLECKIFEELYNSIPPQPSLPLAIHGTNDPDCIGHKISGGCVRMHDRDIVELMGYVRIGMTVEII
ncbi:MAG: L,D-transpeptidase [Candidatus Aenigmarchaeota archaeon]|nr:L,D-transpeptidase [Candidatus Aenigmarchaeota archaeon]